ncbi:MAG: hypothetical protein KTR30_33080 [Saprospiraceae bacterium]|nr:hypothetical protein [Saprospiraceae bacterium]
MKNHWSLQLLSLGVSFLFFASSGFAQGKIRLDFGPKNLAASPSYERIDASRELPVLKWKTHPSQSFHHPKFKAIRRPEWLTGVTAKTLAFTIQLAPGAWQIRLAMEAGTEYISSLSLQINEESQTLGWHGFRPPPEPPTQVLEHFRLWLGEVQSHDGQLHFQFESERDSVRLLSLELVKMDAPSSPKEAWLAEQIQQIGAWEGRDKSIKPLLEELWFEAQKDPDRNWCYQQWQYLELLSRAEEIRDMRGWEWAKRKTRMSMIRRHQQGGMLLDPLLRKPGHPLEERARWLRAKFLHHLDLEYRYRGEAEQSEADFKLLLQAHPSDRLLRMYNGEKIPAQWSRAQDIPICPDAPEWSQKQLKAMQRLQAIVHYWVEERQASNGELGGKLGDDVEALRFWHPLIYTGDALAQEGWIKLADGVWHSQQVEQGYARYMDDVEHASEFISDTAPLLLVATEDTAYHRRTLFTLQHFLENWTRVNSEGLRLFKSAWYSATEIEEEPPKNRDVQYNARAMQPLRYWLWRYPKDTIVRNALYDWSKAWATIAQRTDKGKPAGILPPSIRSTDGAINGEEPTWYKANMFWEYYDFTGDGQMLDQLLFAWQYSEDPALLAPILASLQLIQNQADQTSNAPAGSAAWAASKMLHNRSFWGVAGQWRLLTGDTRFDSLLLQQAPYYVRYQITKDESYLTQGLDQFLETTAYNKEMLTTEVIFTDRLLATNERYGRRLDSEALKAMLTGDVVIASTSPYLAVTWGKTFKGFTALLEEQSRKAIQLSMFNHSAKDQTASLRLWQLEPGNYRIVGSNGYQTSFTKAEAGQSITLPSPAKSLVEYRIEAKKRN